MSGLIFDEETLLDGNIFKFEERLHSTLNRYTDNGMLLTNYFSQVEEATTVDRGIKDIQELFGSKAPIRYVKIENMPINAFGQLNPENSDDLQIEDFNIEGEFTIIPGTVVPKQYDCFMIKHLKMRALFLITGVQYDSMKVDGNYKVHYYLQSTSDKTIEDLESRVIDINYTDLNAIGTNVNPIIRKDDYILKTRIKQMTCKMIESYKALFYNERHNCFLYHDPETGLDYFDMCGNEFMAKHGLMNYENTTKVVMLHEKLRDIQLPFFYNNSIYNWLELGAPKKMLQKFYYILNYAEGYLNSSFVRWGDGDIQIIQPLSLQQVGQNVRDLSYFDDEQIESFLSDKESEGSEYDKLMWKYINRTDLTIHDISLDMGDVLFSSIRHRDVFLYTPIAIYIIRQILMMG